MRIATLLLLLPFAVLPLHAACPASSTAFTGAVIDAPFFVFDGGSRGDGFGQFDEPSSIAEIGGGLLAISDARNHRIKTVTLEGYFQDFWGGEGSGAGEVRLPGAIAPVGDGTVWVVDTGNHRLQRLRAFEELVASITGTHIKTIGGRGSGQGKFETPTGVAIDGAGRLFVVDSGNKRIQKFSASGKFMKAWGDATQFMEPYGIVMDAGGMLYVSDSALHRILKFDANGRLVHSWGGHGSGEGMLDTPRGLALRDGVLYVADSGNARVVKFKTDGTFLGAVGCRGKGVGEFLDPVSVAIDADRHLYVVDRGNHRVQKLGHQ